MTKFSNLLTIFRSYGIHKQKLRSIKGKKSKSHTRNTGNQRTLTFTNIRNRANIYQAAKKQTEILYENQHLLRRIAELQLSSKQKAKTTSMILGKGRNSVIKENQRRISNENRRILDKLLNMKPILDRKKQELDYKIFKRYQNQIRRSNIPNFKSMYLLINSNRIKRCMLLKNRRISSVLRYRNCESKIGI